MGYQSETQVAVRPSRTLSCWQGLRRGWVAPALQFLDDSYDAIVDSSEPGLNDMPQADNDGKLAHEGPDWEFWIRFFRMLAGGTVPPAVALKDQTLVIFDWDDTLLCTTWLRRNEEESFSSGVQLQLRLLGQWVQEVLDSSLRLGHTVIVTNALTSWVEDSAARWLPEVLPILRRVRIVSAREQYEDCYPSDVRQWKVRSFLDLHEEFDRSGISNIVVLGDSVYEMEAAEALGGTCPKALLKTVKFQEKPSVSEHVREMKTVVPRFERLVQLSRNTKISLHHKGTTTAPVSAL